MFILLITPVWYSHTPQKTCNCPTKKNLWSTPQIQKHTVFRNQYLAHSFTHCYDSSLWKYCSNKNLYLIYALTTMHHKQTLFMITVGKQVKPLLVSSLVCLVRFFLCTTFAKRIIQLAVMPVAFCYLVEWPVGLGLRVAECSAVEFSGWDAPRLSHLPGNQAIVMRAAMMSREGLLARGSPEGECYDWTLRSC